MHKNGLATRHDQGWNTFGTLGISDAVTGTVLSNKEKAVNKWTRNDAQLDQLYNLLRLSSNRIKV